MSSTRTSLQSPSGSVSSTRSSSKRLLNTLTLLGSLLILLILLAASQEPAGCDTQQCRSIYMYPSYAKVTGFDTSHTKLALKYNLFLYREQGKDKIPDDNNKLSSLDGIPVLFIPGNAGSYKQVRSIASEASEVFFRNQNNKEYEGKHFDFFSAHFNEDFTAFHGRTMLDQAEYLNEAIKFILSLYSSMDNPPTSVLLIGHSMGGVVSRVMLTLPNYLEGSVNTIITLAAPHAAAPATFDGDIMLTYAATDKFWRNGFYQEDLIPNQRLKDVSLISITGGLSDSVLPADYTTLAGLVPPTHGFTVYTTGIPGVWTPIDHLAIVWCDQLRKVIVSSLFDIVDPDSPSRTKSLNQRMCSFRRNLLTGFEKDALQDYDLAKNPDTSVKLRFHSVDIEIEGNSFASKSPISRPHLISLFNVKEPSLTFLSSVKPENFDSHTKSSALLLCNYIDPSGKGTMIDFFEDETIQVSDYDCVDISSDVYQVPNSERKALQDSSIGGSSYPYYAAKLPPELLSNYSCVLYYETKESSEHYFSSISVDPSSQSIEVYSSILDLLFGVSFTIPGQEISKDIKINSAWSSLLSYKFQAFVNNNNEKIVFTPFIRQWVEDPIETKWHLDLSQPKSISFHGISPYTPFKLYPNPVHLELWSQHSTSNDIKFSIKIDLFESLKLLVLRYRLAIASFPIFIITLVLLIQFNRFYETGKFISFEDGLNILTSKTLLISIILSILTPIASGPFFHWVFYLFDPIAKTNPNELIKTYVNPYFLGLEENFLFILGPLFYTMSLSTVHVLLLIFKGALFTLPFIMIQFEKILNLNDQIIIPKQPDQEKLEEVSTLNKTRRFIGSVLLIIFVMFYIPFQFAYVVCTIVQLIVTLKADFYLKKNIDKNVKTGKKAEDIRKTNFSNFNLSLLMLMIWLIPVNIPVLIVFFHNVGVRWETPFSSHHNILAILPIILLIGKNVQGEFLLHSQNKSQKRIGNFIIAYFAIFALIYGIRHLYWLHYLFNFFSAWLVLVSFWK